MLSRTATMNLSGRSSAMRRLRRRAYRADPLYCRTNGCASFLVLDAESGIATCPICGYHCRVPDAQRVA